MARCAPFGNHQNPQTMLHAICYNEPDLSILPSELRPIVEACLRKDPNQRATLEQITRMLPPSVLTTINNTSWLPPTIQATVVDYAAEFRQRLNLPRTKLDPRPTPARGVNPASRVRRPSPPQPPRPRVATRPVRPKPRKPPLGRRILRTFKRVTVVTTLVAVCAGLWRITPIEDIKNTVSELIGSAQAIGQEVDFETRAETLAERIQPGDFEEYVSGWTTDLADRTYTVNSVSSTSFDLILDITVKGKSSDNLRSLASQACVTLTYTESDVTWSLGFYGDYSEESSTGKSTTGILEVKNALLLPGDLEFRAIDCRTDLSSGATAAHLGTNSINSYYGFIVGSSVVTPISVAEEIDNQVYIVAPKIDGVWTYMQIDGVVVAPDEETEEINDASSFVVQAFEKGEDENLICTYAGEAKPTMPKCNSLTFLQV